MTFRWVLIAALAALAACGKSPAKPGDGSNNRAGDGNTGAEIPPHMPGNPGIGGHGLSFDRFASTHAATIDTPAFTTAATGSTMIVSIGRGKAKVLTAGERAPFDNKGNSPYQLLGSEEPYTLYPDSGTGAYAFPNYAGGDNTIVSTNCPTDDEITISAVEITGATHVSQVWNEQLQPPLTSLDITTTGPAALVAYWWGDNDADQRTAVPNNGFTVIDSALSAGEFVEEAVAVKLVDKAGTYNVTWDATPTEGAQLWLIAVE